MKRTIPFTIILLLISSSIILLNGQTEMVDGNEVPTRGISEFTMDMKISNASLSSFIGEAAEDNSGYSVSGAGDVNGDGYDDILIGASYNGEGGNSAGQTYLILGRSTGWSMDKDLSTVDASFIGEAAGDGSGSSVSGAGDVNGDGFDDILIGAKYNAEGGSSAGQTYLVLGRSTGWSMDTDLSSVDASFIGETVSDYSGQSVSGAGDVNNDGYDDIIIGANQNDEGGAIAGQTYLILGKSTGWSMDTDLSTADASFIGEAAGDYSGQSVSGAGDVNNDGYDDIIIGANQNDEGGVKAGQTYLILGKSTGWSMDTSLSTVNASFIGEAASDYSGQSVSGAGDVNNDGYDDILIGAPNNDEGWIDVGQTYLVLGRSTGWTMDTDLSTVDASFIGEALGEYSGSSVSGAGDVNGDGFDDILISAPNNDESVSGAGQTYLILGHSTDWSMDTDLSTADASFMGEGADDFSGNSVSGAGDVNGDGFDDIIIGANQNDEGGNNAGQTYLISMEGFSGPLEVYGVKVRNMIGQNIRSADKEEFVEIELVGLDSNNSHIDRARVNVTFSSGDPDPTIVSLLETGMDTGIYRGVYQVDQNSEYFDIMRVSAYIDLGKFYNVGVDYPYRPESINLLELYSSLSFSTSLDKLDFGETGYILCMGEDANNMAVDKSFVNITSDKNSSLHQMIVLTETGLSTGAYASEFTIPDSMQYFENITLTSVETPTFEKTFMVHTPVKIRTQDDYHHAKEDMEYKAAFENFGYSSAIWKITEYCPWVEWDNNGKVLHGTPDNNHVGDWWVRVNITDGYNHFDEWYFLITVENTAPDILTENLLKAKETEQYYVDYNSTDDGQGDISWTLDTKADWLEIDEVTGELTGTPTLEDAGWVWVTVQVKDGHEGLTGTLFNLSIINKNIAPRITSSDVLSISQNEPFVNQYVVYDPDEGDVPHWSLITDANFLSIDNDTGRLSGTPGPLDVGIWDVNVTVTDSGGLSASSNYQLEVRDVNDIPYWTDIPEDSEVVYGKEYIFDVNGSDYDEGGFLVYSISTKPPSDIGIDPDSGLIQWTASMDFFDEGEDTLEVTIKLSDGELFNQHKFELKVLPSQSPYATLIGPVDGQKVVSSYVILTWEGVDPDDDPVTYSLFLSENEIFVENQREESRLATNHQFNNYNVSGVTIGKTFYWTVVPDDGCSLGTCTNGIQSFKVNTPPKIDNIPEQIATVGSNYKFKVPGIDDDPEDQSLLTYTLISGLEGIDIDPDTGIITWKPSSEQTGRTMVEVSISDGYQTTVTSFYIEVSGSDESGFPIAIVIIAIAVLLVIIILVVFLVLRKKSKDEDEMDEETKRIQEEIEQHKNELEWESGIYKKGETTSNRMVEGEEDNSSLSSVPLSATEAHAHDHDKHKPLGYEDLYGQPAIESEEGDVTAEELKDHIDKAVKDLENIEVDEEN